MDTFSYLDGIILNPFSFSLTSIWLSSLSYPLSATTTDNGFIFDTFVIIGLKSILSRLVGVLLTLILHIICFRTSVPIESLAVFLPSL